jgi:hypothetical protein
MTDPAISSDSKSNPTEDAAVVGSSEEHRGLLRLETRLARAEAQVRALQEGMAELHLAARASKQRALYLRIGILLALIGAFFFIRAR